MKRERGGNAEENSLGLLEPLRGREGCPGEEGSLWPLRANTSTLNRFPRVTRSRENISKTITTFRSSQTFGVFTQHRLKINEKLSFP